MRSTLSENNGKKLIKSENHKDMIPSNIPTFNSVFSYSHSKSKLSQEDS